MGVVENIITDNLPIWSSAIQSKSSAGRGIGSKQNLYGIKKLRELILDFAVRGLLVSQDPSDEPATVLLERIAAERTTLVKSKEIRKQKVLGSVSAKEQFHPLPVNWVAIRLNDVGDWGAGATPLRGRSELYGGSIPWFKSGELNADYISHSDESITELALRESSLRLNNVGDVLLAMYGATIGKASILNIKATTNQAVCACRVYSGVSNSFLLTLLKAYRPRFIEMGAGGAQPNISREKIIATPINLPPTAEQHRIVAKVDELMALCDTLEQQQEGSIQAHEKLVEVLLDALSDAVDAEAFQAAWVLISKHFDELFTTEHSINKLKETILQLAVMGKLVPQDPSDEPASILLEKIAAEKERLIEEGKIKSQKIALPLKGSEFLTQCPRGWVITCIAEIAQIQPKNTLNDNTDVGFVEMSSISSDYDGSHEQETRRWLKVRKGYTHIKDGDIGLAKVTPCFENSKAAIFKGLKNGVGAATTELHTARLFGNKIVQEFILYHLKSSKFLSLGKSRMTGTSGLKRVPKDFFASYPITVAPTAEQYRIVAKVNELMALCEQLQGSLEKVQETQILLTDAVVENAL